jgi:hypothetical protein
MKARCFDKNLRDYKNYWLRGITVCEKWKTFEGFYEDMFETYTDNLTLDRTNNAGNYSKDNCKWATRYEQAQNTRKVRFIEYNWIKKSLTDLAIFLGIKRKTLSQRLNWYGWSIEKAFTKI